MSESESLRLLRDEAFALAARSSISPEEVEDWRRRTLASLEEAYGQGSLPVQNFSSIKFDDAVVIEAAEQVLRDKATEKAINLDSLKIELPPAENALRQGLYEAAELLLSLSI